MDVLKRRNGKAKQHPAAIVVRKEDEEIGTCRKDQGGKKLIEPKKRSEMGRRAVNTSNGK
jgi:hypothetical protein|eukprot:evm.model.NODE_2382_length_1700_cov_33.311176.1